MSNPYIDEWGKHLGYCNGCDTEAELGQECQECEDGEVVPYDDDPEEEPVTTTDRPRPSPGGALPPFTLAVFPITDTMLNAVRRGMLARGEEPDQHPDECECAVCEVGRALDDDADMATSSDYWL